MSNFTHSTTTPITDSRSNSKTQQELLSAEEQVCLRQALDSLICSPRASTLEAIFKYAETHTSNNTPEHR
ncbi:hypothetical protein KTO58_21575 [Chitinophaga pendula]|uniref:hypothetical protein n=1 Tax=Chitinophaga TaxID=79328 RepID=UPI000BB0042C|nr:MULTISPECIES: hypothetical protein [Chitinophaga]ASZ10783.1 hypothetical protein CK934_07225 [Chitinophaga sp. MD30]UCJ06240.1 hypothetical protein KTO58_21575 [Chitinophaga pendula]